VGLATICVGDNATCLTAGGIGIGGGTIPGAAGITIGTSSQGAAQAIAIGHGAIATRTGGVALGDGAEVKTTGTDGVAIGNEALVQGTDSTAVGGNSSVTASDSTAIGASSSVTAAEGTALGATATVTTAGGMALGFGATASDDCTALGPGASCSDPNVMVLPAAYTGFIPDGTTTDLGSLTDSWQNFFVANVFASEIEIGGAATSQKVLCVKVDGTIGECSGSYSSGSCTCG
jgi:hypothetical protein